MSAGSVAPSLSVVPQSAAPVASVGRFGAHPLGMGGSARMASAAPTRMTHTAMRAARLMAIEDDEGSPESSAEPDPDPDVPLQASIHLSAGPQAELLTEKEGRRVFRLRDAHPADRDMFLQATMPGVWADRERRLAVYERARGRPNENDARGKLKGADDNIDNLTKNQAAFAAWMTNRENAARLAAAEEAAAGRRAREDALNAPIREKNRAEMDRRAQRDRAARERQDARDALAAAAAARAEDARRAAAAAEAEAAAKRAERARVAEAEARRKALAERSKKMLAAHEAKRAGQAADRAEAQAASERAERAKVAEAEARRKALAERSKKMLAAHEAKRAGQAAERASRAAEAAVRKKAEIAEGKRAALAKRSADRAAGLGGRAPPLTGPAVAARRGLVWKAKTKARSAPVPTPPLLPLSADGPDPAPVRGCRRRRVRLPDGRVVLTTRCARRRPVR